MAIKTFTTGEVLTAADTNTYLANSGLVYVTQASWTSQTGVNIDNCFTSTYANYRIMLDLTSFSSNDTFLFQFRDSGGAVGTANYDWQLLEYAGTAITGLGQAAGTWSRLSFSYASPGYVFSIIDIFNPQASLRTQWNANSSSQNGTTATLVNNVARHFRTTGSMTGIRFGTLNGTYTFSGKARVYGYRNS